MGYRSTSSRARPRRLRPSFSWGLDFGARGWFYPVLVLFITFLTFTVRVYHLDTMGLDGDEAFSIRAAYSSFTEIVELGATTDSKPPLYYSLLRSWYHVAGLSEFALRYPSVVAGVLTVTLLAKVAGLFAWRAAGLIAALLFGFNPYQVWYAQNARMYTLLALFGLAALFFALRALQPISDRRLRLRSREAETGPGARRGNARLAHLQGGRLLYLVLYVATMALTLYAHYYGAFLFVFVNVLACLWLWSQRRLRADFPAWAGAQVVTVVLFAPWLVLAQRMVLSYVDYVAGSVDLLAILKQSVLYYSLGNAPMPEAAFGFSLGFLAIAVAGLWTAGRKGGQFPSWFRWSFLCGYLFMAPVLGFLVSQFRVMFEARYFMVGAPAFYLALGLGVTALFRRAPIVGVAAGLFVFVAQLVPLNAYFHDPSYVKSDFREAAMYIREHARPGDAIIVDGWSQTYQFWYYYTMKAPQPVSSYVFPPNVPDRWGSAARDLDDIMARHQGVWLLDYDYLAYDPQHVVETHLARNYYQALVQRTGTNRVAYYASTPPSASDPVPLDVSFEGELLLKDVAISKPAARGGEIVQVALRWDALKDIQHDYAMSWRLLDSAGHVVLQRDAQPASGFRATSGWGRGEEVVDRYGLPIPAYLPPGQHSLSLLVYDKRSGVVLQPRHGDQPLPFQSVTLGRIQVLDEPAVGAIDEPSPSQPANMSLGALTLIGFDLGRGPYRPGDTISARLFWRMSPSFDREHRAVMRLLSAAGEPVQETAIGLVPTRNSGGRREEGQVFATFVDVPVPAQSSTGAYRLMLSVQADGLGEDTFSDFPSVPIVSRERRFTVPTIGHPGAADFGGLIELLGYDLQSDAADAIGGGGSLPLTLYWRAQGAMTDSYKVFVHLAGEDGQIYGQRDSIPLGGKAPTVGWVPGEVLVDPYEVPIKPGAPHGRYRLLIGLYQEETGQRMKLADGSGDSLPLTEIVTEPKGAPGQR